MKKLITILIIVLAAFGILLGATALIKKANEIPPNPSDFVGNTAGNLYNGGYFCEKNGYVYFANPYDNYALYRMLPDETQMERLLTTKTKCINVDEHYIFYYRSGSGEGEGLGYLIDTSGVYRADLKDGKNAVCLDKVTVENLLLLGNSIYYDAINEDEVSLKRMDISSKEQEIVLPYKVSACQGHNSCLYFADTLTDMNLKFFNPASGQISTMFESDVYQPIISGNTVYYIDVHNGYALTSLDLSTSTKTVLSKDRTDLFNVSKNYVYYQTSGKTPQLKRVSKDGTQDEVILDGAYNSIQVTSQYVYFKQFNCDIPVYRMEADGSTFVSTFDRAYNAALKNIK